MVDLDALGVAIRIVAYTIAAPGLVAWAMITYRRRQRGISALMLVTSLFLLCMLGADYARYTSVVRDTLMLISTVFAVTIAVIVVVSLRNEFKRGAIPKKKKKVRDLADAELRRSIR